MVNGFGWLLPAHWQYGLAGLFLLVVGIAELRLRRRLKRLTVAHRRERRMREELEAYAGVDASLAKGQAGVADRVEANKALAKRMCRTIAEKSAFARVGMMLRDVEGRLYCAGSVGVDDLTVKALDGWGQRVVDEERGVVTSVVGAGGSLRAGPMAVRHGVKSFAIALGEWTRFDPEVAEWAMAGKRERRRWRRALVAPVRMSSGKIAGAIVVCADGPRGGVRDQVDEGLERAMGPIEALAFRVAGSLEREVMGERLQRAEKLAGLGQLARGVADALNTPLTSVLGFADLIAETAGEMRVRQDAETIRAEALKMKDTVQKLVEFWRPSAPMDESMDLAEIIQELAAECRDRLRAHRVELTVQTEETVSPVHGDRDRMRVVLRHLLNNAAQAIAAAELRAAQTLGDHRFITPDEGHSIRVTVSEDDRSVQIVVSDTGTGFAEPGRIFDPFYTTRGPQAGGGPEAGAGMGLSLSYGIVREHGGEISAFNLYPRGAAVVVELPLGAKRKEALQDRDRKVESYR